LAQVSFKDLVQIFAEQNGVLLVPKPGRMHNGRQVRLRLRILTRISLESGDEGYLPTG
jgi:hypothetical protein